MTNIRTLTCPTDGTGKDPNDFRRDPEFIQKLNQQLEKPASVFDWTSDFVLTDEEAEMISEPEWIIENLVIQGHVIAIVAEPNGGKTTLFFHLSGEMAESGYQVFYVNADISGGDAKSMVISAKEDGFTLMLPDMAGQSMEQVVTRLQEMNDSGGNFESIIFIFDTLKKMTDVISKSKAKELYRLLRGLSAKGMTSILLAHTNKYKDAEGNPVFEGTADLRSDVDELIYLIPEKQPDSSMIVSTKPDKVRGAFTPISFELSPQREVKRLESYVDTAASVSQARQMEKDATVIEAITESIQKGQFKQSAIVAFCKEQGFGWRTTESVLKRYNSGNQSGQKELWRREKAMEKNAWVYQLTEQFHPPIEGGECENW
ncbi:MAG: AAA family ATPase [Candidatus Sedimenticola sp. (ex Thyasira tokunagai)]